MLYRGGVSALFPIVLCNRAPLARRRIERQSRRVALSVPENGFNELSLFSVARFKGPEAVIGIRTRYYHVMASK